MQINSITLLKGSKHLTKFLFCLILRNLVFKRDDYGSLPVMDNMCGSVLSHMDLLKWLRYQQSLFIPKTRLQIQIIALWDRVLYVKLSLNMTEYSRKGLESLLAGTYGTNVGSVYKIYFLNHVWLCKIKYAHVPLPHSSFF